MCVGQAGQHGLQHGERLGHRQRPAGLQHVTQIPAVDKLHHQEHQRRRTVAVGALVVHVDDAGVVQPGRGPRLALEATPELRV